MIFWALFIPLTALFFILYFQFIDKIFNGKKKAMLIRENELYVIPKREIINTLINLLIFSAAGVLIGWLIKNGYSPVYSTSVSTAFDYLFLVIGFFAALGIHDFYFYWSHRFLHVPFVFKHVHASHHLSHEVNPWSSFSFHPIEAVIQIGIIVVVALLLPIHEFSLMAFTILLILISVYGHCGYELRINKWKGFNVFNTSFHHYQHHKEVRFNFGIYLTLWDKLFKTESPRYDESFSKLKATVHEKLSKRN